MVNVELLSYKYVPPGFEILIGEKEISPGSKGGIWNLWWNIQLTDDPDAWDEEVKAINMMQQRLGEVATDLRLIRSHMAEFCRVSPLFPESVDILCEEISVSHITKPYKLGCEGRRLLESLGYHDAVSERAQKLHLSMTYAKGLKRWLSGERPQIPVDAKVSGFLGDVTEEKETFVKGIVSRLELEEYSPSLIKEMCEAECMKMMGKSFNTRARPFHCLVCNECLCSYGTLIDAGILCTRTCGDEASVLNEYRRFAEEYILSYAFALNSWLQDSTVEPVTSLAPCRYLTEEIARQIPKKVHDSLGDRDDLKVWLVSCLLKTLKSNQRWHKRHELIDDFPQASSWLPNLASQ